MAEVTICSDFGAPQNKVCHCFHCFLTYLPWSNGTTCHDLGFSECRALNQLFHSPLSLSARGFLFLFTFCHKGGVISISEVIDISPSNFHSSLCFIQPSISHDVPLYKLNKQGDNIQPLYTPFPIWNQSVVPCPVLTVASWSAYRFLKRQVRWSAIPTS